LQAFKYISFIYLKYFLIILSALVLFMAGFDYMDNAHKLPDSANLVIIYVMLKSFFAIDMMLPLSLVFAMIATKVNLIHSNALVAFYSLGYSKTDILKPFVVVSSIVVLIFISLHATSFARADEYSNNLKSSTNFLKPTSNLFFTYENKYVYFGKLYPLEARATDIRVFSAQDSQLSSVITASNAQYIDGYWRVKDATKIIKPRKLSYDSAGVNIQHLAELKLLKDFRPKILDQVVEGKVNYTILDAVDALLLFNKQNVNIDRIKSALYKIFIYPLFVPFLIIIIFFFVPISSRMFNVTLFSFGAILATLMIWAILFAMIELSNNKTIPSEVGIIFPIIVLFFLSMFQWHRSSQRN